LSNANKGAVGLILALELASLTQGGILSRNVTKDNFSIISNGPLYQGQNACFVVW